MKNIRNSNLFAVFNLKDDLAKGRVSMLISSIIVTINSFLTAGIFHTAFLIANDIDLVKVGIISFIPFAANGFSIFSPFILERFKKRKLILSIGRVLYYTINILGVTLLPLYIKDSNAKVIAFAILVFISSAINALTVTGYAAWHINFIPNKVRADYLSYMQTLSYIFTGTVLIISSVIADKLRGSSNENTVLFCIRFFAYFIAIVEVIILALPKEFPYASKTKVKLKNVFTLPFSYKPFIFTMLIVFLWTYVQNLTYSLLDYYLLNDVGAEYTFINLINAGYALFLLAFSKRWKRILDKYSWFKTFAIAAIMLAPTSFLYSFATKTTYIPIMLIVRLTQHFIGVGLNLTFANMVYVNLPDEDRTNYTSFHQFGANISAFFGMLTGTTYVALTNNLIFKIGSLNFTSVQQLLIIQSIGQLLVAFLVVKLRPKVEVHKEE